jgi:hypothetical protein
MQHKQLLATGTSTPFCGIHRKYNGGIRKDSVKKVLWYLKREKSYTKPEKMATKSLCQKD